MKQYNNDYHPVQYYFTSFSKICFLALLSLFCLNNLVIAQDVDEKIDLLRQQLKQQSQRIEELEKAQSKKISGNDNGPVVTVGGTVQLEAIYNWPSVGGAGGSNNGDLALIPRDIPLSDSGERGQLNLHGRYSRIWLKSRKLTPQGDVSAFIEIDFWGSAGHERVHNSHNPRLRHAFAEIGRLTVGQTNSTFVGAGNANTLTLLASNLTMRQPLIRWTEKYDDDYLQISLEQPETTLTDSTGSRITPDDDRYPDIAGEFTWHSSRGDVSLSGLLREIRSDGATVAGIEDHAWGKAVYISGRLNTFGVDNFRFGIAYGDALGRYVAGNTFNDGAIDLQGQIKLQTIVNVLFSYQYWWSNKLRSNLAYGYVHVDNDLSIVPVKVDKEAYTAHLNLIYTPMDKVLFGIEYIRGEREQENRQRGKLDRVHFRMAYNF